MFGKYGVTFSLIFLLISFLLCASLIQGSRPSPTSTTHVSSTPSPLRQMSIKEEKMVLRGEMGSKPPRCTGRCRSCGHCEAIQVPTNPRNSRSSVTIINTNYARGSDNYSDYKPMSWKCKCGSSIFNP